MAKIDNIVLSESEVGPPLPLNPEYKPSAQIVELPAAATVEEVMQILDRDGGVILADFVSQEDLASIERDTTSNLGNPDDRKGFEGFIPKETILVGGLVGKSKIIQKLCLHPLLQGLREEILTDKTYTIREDTRNPVQVNPLLSLSLSFRIRYGAPRQRLHRDDVIHLIDHSPPFELRKVSQFACLVAGVETTRENGATMFVPGSHRWDDLRKPRLDEVAFAG
jgi:ectoine hydroxylase-related dioxygenase (phytanoyl-CoA dioxygenase family)